MPAACPSISIINLFSRNACIGTRMTPLFFHDQITVFDPALTRPWTVDKKYVRDPAPRPDWVESYCTEEPSMVAIGKDAYFLSSDGMLMPGRKNQPPPDLRYFKRDAR